MHKAGSEGLWTFSECSGKESVVSATESGAVPSQVPPFVTNEAYFNYWECCGSCHLDTPEVRLYYFEATNGSHCSANISAIVGPDIAVNSNTSNELQSVARRLVSIQPSGSIAVVGGQTLTSPSVYLEFVGTMGVTDHCGAVGSPLTSQLIAFPPDALSTYDVSYASIGEEFMDPLTAVYHGMYPYSIPSPKALNVQKLQCPTFGVGTSTRTQGNIITTIGPPWLPLISPPPEILSLNPMWNSICMGNLTFNAAMKSLAIFDPPRVLVPGEGLVPDLHSSAEAVPTPGNVQQDPSPQPVQTPRPDLPIQTGPSEPSVRHSPTASDDPVASFDPQSNDPHDENVGTGGADGSNNKSPQQSDQVTQNTPHDPSTSDQAVAANGNDPAASAGSGKNKQPNQASAIDLGSTHPANEGSSSSSLGVSDPNALSSDSPEGSPKESSDVATSLKAGVPLAVGSFIFTPAPTGLIAAGKTLLPQGPPISIAGTPISLATSNAIIIGGNTYSINSSKLLYIDPQPQLTVGGQSFTAAATGFVVGNTYILPEAPAATVSGTRISLGPSGLLLIGSDLTSLPLGPTVSDWSTFTIAGQIVIPDPSGVLSGAATMLPGSGDLTVGSGHSSLGASGALEVSDSVTTLGSPSQNGTQYPAGQTGNGTVIAFTGNAKRFELRFDALMTVMMWLWVYFD